MESTTGAEWRERFVEVAPFYTNKQIPQFISQTEVNHILDHFLGLGPCATESESYRPSTEVFFCPTYR